MCLRNKNQLSQSLREHNHGWLKKIKFGIRAPQTVNEAMRNDENNGNNLWRDWIEKEIDGVMIAFKILDEGENPPPTYQ